MRIIINDYPDSVELTEFNAYGIEIRKTIVEAGERVSLSLTSAHHRVFLDCVMGIYIYKGEGELLLSECGIEYNFNHVDVRELDFYLQKGRIPPRCKDMDGIWKFVACSELNLAAGKDKITPPRYYELWASLLEGGKTCAEVLKL